LRGTFCRAFVAPGRSGPFMNAVNSAAHISG